ncbi:MAG: helix-turn-helix transcriptional regulator [Myxococcota bacterium]
MKLIDEFGYGGMLLKVVRERLGLRISDIADHTRISVRYLDALEAEDHESLPAATFVRGYVREVARMLHLDPEAVVGGFMSRAGRAS